MIKSMKILMLSMFVASSLFVSSGSVLAQSADRPGNGFGDKNHHHTGPPGHSEHPKPPKPTKEPKPTKPPKPPKHHGPKDHDEAMNTSFNLNLDGVSIAIRGAISEVRNLFVQSTGNLKTVSLQLLTFNSTQ